MSKASSWSADGSWMYPGSDSGAPQWAVPPPPLGAPPPPVGAPPPPLGPPPPIGPPPPVGAPLPTVSQSSSGAPSLPGVLHSYGTLPPTAAPPPPVAPPASGAPPPSLAIPPPSFNHSIPTSGSYHDPHLYSLPPPGPPEQAYAYPNASAVNIQHHEALQGPPPNFNVDVTSRPPASTEVLYGNQASGPPPSYYSYPVTQPAGPPSSGFYDGGGYGAAYNTPSASEYYQNNSQNSFTPRNFGGPCATKESWSEGGWGGKWDASHKSYNEERSTKSVTDRTVPPSRNNYRGHGRGDRKHISSSMERTSNSSTKYKSERGSRGSQYTEEHYGHLGRYPEGKDGRHRDQGSRMKRPHPRDNFIRSSRSSSPRRKRRTSPERYDREHKMRHSKSPESRSCASPRSQSPERKRQHASKDQDRAGSSSSSSNSNNTTKKISSLTSTLDRYESKEEPPLDISKDKEDVADMEEVQEEENDKDSWVRSAPADLYYQRDEKNPVVMRATKKLITLCESMEEKLIKRAVRVRDEKKKQREGTEKNPQKLTDCQGDGKAAVCRSEKSDCKVDGTKESMSSFCGNNNVEDKNGKTSSAEDVGKKDDEALCSGETLPFTILNKGETMDSTTACKSKHKHKHKTRTRSKCDSSESSSSDSNSDNSSSSEDDDEENDMDRVAKELEKKRGHPDRLHPELWFNDEGEMNDGPLCRCSLKARRSGIRHGYYVGEDRLVACNPWTNNADTLHHYRITISPPTNFLIKTPTVIMHDSHEFIFEGFSLLSHHPLEEVPTCRVIRFNIEYTILYIQEKIPENFCIQELDIFYTYLFHELLELVDLNLQAMEDLEGCPRFHFMPRFVRKLPDNGKEILSMNEVLNFLLKSSVPLMQPEDLATLLSMPQYKWQNYADHLKGMIVTCPGMKPCSIRVDQLDRDQVSEEIINYPVIVHFGIRPPQLSYAGNPEYQKAWREYVKFRHLLANMPKPSFEDKRRLEAKENRLQEMRMTSKMKRDVTVAVSAQGFFCTGIMCDVVQHAMLLPVLVCHLRFHRSLEVLEKNIGYKFKNRFLLQLALTHPSYRENFGTNPDHARNSLTNCGIRQPEYGDRRIHYMNTRKRGINTLINIMSRFGRNLETESKITHNERLEFLGDAVVEFLTSIHLFHLFPSLEEGGLATYRAAIVQNQHLAVLAEKLGLDQFMLYAHGSDLCHDSELRHAMANCFEALMGAIFLDSGIEEADSVLSSTLFKGEEVLYNIWVNYPPHPLQEQEPYGDRKWIKSFPILTKLAKFEDTIGIQFNHIRLLARAFTDRSIGFNNLTLGSNQRLEFLGDTVLQLVASEYLYKYFPEHHEGHLSLLRSSLVNNRTQAVVCDDLGMTTYAMYSHLKTELKTKDRADLLEAFLGALYIDRGLDYCRTFCQVCFFPRLHHFIMNQDWNDPKSKLQQCCLTLRTMDGGEPDIPIYKVIECKGPTNTRVYTVAVYFRGRRLAKASGHSIQQAEMNAARDALMNSKDLFPQLDHQRRVIEKSVKIQGVSKPDSGRRDKEQRDKDRKYSKYRRDERHDKDRPREETKGSEINRSGSREPKKIRSSSREPDKIRNGTKQVDRERKRESREEVNRYRGEEVEGKMSRTKELQSDRRAIEVPRKYKSGSEGSSLSDGTHKAQDYAKCSSRGMDTVSQRNREKSREHTRDRYSASPSQSGSQFRFSRDSRNNDDW